jgi:hypothetical protein
MSRLIVLLQRPDHLSRAESVEWLHTEVEQLADISGVERIDVSSLGSASLHFGREWDWLLELHLEPDVTPEAATGDSRCTYLLADLRLLGMRPTVAAVGATITVPRPH